jgi:deazaflavin-dependent oxidoreductase (nitroreductase family)
LACYQDNPRLGYLLDGQSRPRRVGVWLGRLVDMPRVGPWIALAARSPMSARPATTRITRFHAVLLRLTRGRLRRSWVFAAGQPVLALTTTGRRSGQPRTTTVAGFQHGEDLVLAAMALGSRENPAWSLNLRAYPCAAIAIGGETIDVLARAATGEEAAHLWARWVELQPSAGAFRELAGREIPLFVLRARGAGAGRPPATGRAS